MKRHWSQYKKELNHINLLAVFIVLITLLSSLQVKSEVNPRVLEFNTTQNFSFLNGTGFFPFSDTANSQFKSQFVSNPRINITFSNVTIPFSIAPAADVLEVGNRVLISGDQTVTLEYVGARARRKNQYGLFFAQQAGGNYGFNIVVAIAPKVTASSSSSSGSVSSSSGSAISSSSSGGVSSSSSSSGTPTASSSSSGSVSSSSSSGAPKASSSSGGISSSSSSGAPKASSSSSGSVSSSSSSGAPASSSSSGSVSSSSSSSSGGIPVLLVKDFTGVWKASDTKNTNLLSQASQPDTSSGNLSDSHGVNIDTFILCVKNGKLEGTIDSDTTSQGVITSQVPITKYQVNLVVKDKNNKSTSIRLNVAGSGRLIATFQNIHSVEARKVNSNKECLMSNSGKSR